MPVYLSRVEIDTANRRKIRDLNHLGAYHSWVEESFPEEIVKGERSRKLWRIDHLHGRDYLLLVSPDKPDLNRLEKYGVEGSAATKPYDTYLDQLSNNMRARFKVTLNPVVSLSQPGDKRGRVVPHVTVEAQRQFLKDKSKKNGFEVEDDDFYVTERSFERLKKSGKKDLKLSKATFEGVLKIIDADTFKETLSQGFGKKKAYGFGLMTVIPVE